MNVGKVKVNNIFLRDTSITQLNRMGVHVPTSAIKCKALNMENKGAMVDVYSFYDSKNRLIKRMRQVSDPETKDVSTQISFYDYSQKNNKSKFAKISQYKFDAENNCIAGNFWHFYYPKFEKVVRYAKSGTGGEKNNFITASDYIVDRNGIKIRPVSIAEYLENKRKLGMQNFVGSPWTVAESKTRESAATDSVAECTVVGIIGKKGISLNHFNPANKKNSVFSTIENKLSEELEEQGKDPKVFMLGSSDTDTGSDLQFRAIDDFLTSRSIRHSKYKTGDKVLYDRMPRLTYINCYNFLSNFGIYNHNEAYSQFYGKTGQHILYKDGELLLANPIIDKELIKGNKNARDLIKKSFQHIDD